MMQPTFVNAAIVLVLIVAFLIGLAAIARRFGVTAALRDRGQARQSGTRRSVRIDRSRVLSIIELDGARFAILTGGRADQMMLVPPVASRDLPS